MEIEKVNVERFDNNLLIGEANVITDCASDAKVSANEACKVIQNRLPQCFDHLEAKEDIKSIQEIGTDQPSEKKVNFTFELFSKEDKNIDTYLETKQIKMRNK